MVSVSLLDIKEEGINHDRTVGNVMDRLL